VLQTLREIPRYPFAPIRVEIEGRVEEAASVIVCKGRLYAGRFVLAAAADPRQEAFHVALFRDAGALAALRHAAALPLGLLPRLRGVDLVPASRLRIEGAAIPIQTDGDPAPGPPLAIAAAPALRIVVP
jgi:diacylglycerol kinase family enzyme